MVLLQCRDLRYNPGGGDVLNGVSFSVGERQRVGLVGTNGSGKSSLLRILAGEVEPDGGEVVRRRGLSVALVSQFLPKQLVGRTLTDAVGEVAPSAHSANEMLSRLGFTGVQRGQHVDSMSGGEVNRMLLARAVVCEPDLILLDEPTNHLDVESVVHFQRFVTEYVRTAFVLVSHDRALLDALSERTVFLRGGAAQSFELSYSRARHALQEAEAEALQRRAAEHRSIERVRASMKRLAHWGQVHDNEKFARKARSMGKRIERMEEAQTAAPWIDRRRLGMQGDAARANRLLDVERLAVRTPEGRNLFVAEGFYLRRGDRVAILGENGSGKSTFLRHLREVAYAPERRSEGVRFNPQVRVGYYDQELSELGPERSLLQTLVAVSPQPLDRLRAALSTAGFLPRWHDRKVATLSGGEKSRLLFLVLELSKPNLLMLDEPTNHMDLEGCEGLEDELLGSDASVLFVSHDRRFTESVASRLVCIRNDGLVEVESLAHYFASVGRDGHTEAPQADGVRLPEPGGQSVMEDTSQDELLARLMELEGKLVADRARRPKHQKPQLQAIWEAEIAAIYQRLD